MSLSKMNENRRVFLDLETTGLDPQRGVILEIAIVITDAELSPLHWAAWQIHVDVTSLRISEIDDFVIKMHADNGLWKACQAWKSVQLWEAVSGVCDTIRAYGAVGAPLCGSSAHADRDWLLVHAPEILDLLHYRILDASGVRLAAESIGAKTDRARGDSTHRALDDCFDSIELVKQSRDYGRGWRAVWLHVKAAWRALVSK